MSERDEVAIRGILCRQRISPALDNAGAACNRTGATDGRTDRKGAQQSRRKGESDAANKGARQEGCQIAQTQGSCAQGISGEEQEDRADTLMNRSTAARLAPIV